jgi:ABC-type polysaccharide/polyol phosphate export permease
MRSSSSLLENANLITKTVFPAEMLSVSIFLSSLINHLLALGLALAIVGFYIGHFSLWMFSLPIYMLQIGLMAVGIGWIVASLQVYLRDTGQVISVLLNFWFWLTPIMIDEQHFPEQVRFLLHLNPLTFVVKAYRERLLSYRVPSLHDFVIVTAFAMTAFVAGGLFFRHLKRGFADVL